MTPLAKFIAARIRAGGPMPLTEYMGLCLGHPEHGYYTTRDPLGLSGDFITAPEISQVFGELIGAWVAATWQEQGEKPFRLIELGPGRGTLMKDALRATLRVPGFHEQASLHLVEMSPVLRAAQSLSLAGGPLTPSWHRDIEEIPDDLPWFVIANEFFDALPIAQYRQGTNRHVTVEGGNFAFIDLPCDAILAPPYPAAPEGIWERCLAGEAILARLAARIVATGGAALIIDYGYAGGTNGDTLQAVRRHMPCSPLEHQGEADLTAHVDFLALQTIAARAGCHTALLSQGAFLRHMGIDLRLDALHARTTPEQAAALKSGAMRLTEPNQMGELFKVLMLSNASAKIN
ncbi:MAG: SAM-dependent methyltransferase [Alphaproteobacteria bacterium]|nr:SAM-dependent methyltransferase [Alphaproteobacteria bacterium]